MTRTTYVVVDSEGRRRPMIYPVTYWTVRYVKSSELTPTKNNFRRVANYHQTSQLEIPQSVACFTSARYHLYVHV
jgi:hypothetical protein